MVNRGWLAVVPAMVVAAGVAAEEPVRLDEVSVTATREARPTKDVPQSISVIGKREIEEGKVLNVKDALAGTPGVVVDSRNGGYDARLIIRGAGLKARYGVREIMMLRDGVPMTDPDSFTRLDFIDTQDIEQIEVVKGPGSIFATGSSGGTIQIISKSVFDTDNRAKIGFGNEGQELYHARVGGMVGENQAVSVAATRKVLDNEWRRWNHFDTNQVSLKHGLMIADGVLESEISWSEADLQLPGSMNRAQFEQFQRTGRQTDTDDAWKHNGRYSKILFANSRFEREFGDFTIKPRVYFTAWEHYHPVPGLINVSDDNYVFGTDLEGNWRHQLLGRPSTLVAGLTARQDQSKDARKYTYRDVVLSPVTTNPAPPNPDYFQITRTLSDQRGDLAEVSDTTNTIYGLFAQESVHLTDRLLLDAGFRLDQSKFEIDTDEMIAFVWGSNYYRTGAGRSSIDADFLLFSPKIGLTYSVTPQVSVYASAAQAGQVPSSSEIESNPALDAALATSYEVGLKARYQSLRFDAAVYYATVEDDIVASLSNNQTLYSNAGETRKQGLEIEAGYHLGGGLTVGGSYAYSDYEFTKFTEVRYGRVSQTVDWSGNKVPFIPRHQYALFAEYRHPVGVHARAETLSYGSYWLDNGNTEKYGGYDFVTNLTVGYDIGAHSLSLHVDNVFDEHYAGEVSKDINGNVSYYAASPRLWMLTYRYTF